MPGRDLQHFLRFVEWRQVTAKIAKLADSHPGREAAEGMEPLFAANVVAELQAATLEARALVQKGRLCKLEGTAHLPQAFERAREQDRSLTTRELRSVSTTLEVAERAREAYSSSPLLGALVAGAEEDAEAEVALREAIDAAIGPYGDVRDDASEDLLELRRRLIGHQAMIEDGLRRLISDGSVLLALLEHRPMRCEGRPALLIKDTELHRVPGPILAHEPGRYYVQPDALAPLYNELRDLSIAVERECFRIAYELSERVASLKARLEDLSLGLIQADIHQAMARYASSLGGREVQEAPLPSVSGARHPLLAESQDCVPLTFSLPQGTRLLLISGPNGGGKTAAMKTVALLALLAQVGCPVPADSCSLPVYRGFLAVADTKSSVGEGLSTFQAHAADLCRALSGAEEGFLVLLDEIGVGTDPGEAAALAQAFLEELLKRDLLMLATTHLTPLKSFATRHPTCETAAVALNDDGQPTFSLHLGQVGRSYALEVARQAGLPETICARAAVLHRGSEA
jgi:DNA mismatch repair protein MutS2